MDKITLQEMEKWGHYADWSIHADTSGDIDNWVLENRVGTEWIADLTDGTYKFRHTVLDYLCENEDTKTLTMKNEVLIRSGRVDIASVLAAVDEYIERTGDSDHKFVEMLFDNGDGTLSVGLGS